MAGDDYWSALRLLKQEFDILKERFEALSKRLTAKRAEIREGYREHLDLIERDKSVAYRYIRDKDPSLRLLADVPHICF